MNFLIFFSSLLARSECIMWYNAQPNPENFINNLPPCPPIIPSNSSSNFFTMYYTDRLCNTFNREKCNIYHPNAQTCYRSFRRWTSYGWAYQKCCYDDQNQLLVGPPGGGTPILWPFNGDGSEYEAYLPYYKCCILSKNCHLYYQKRPSDDSSRWINDGIAFVTGDPHFLTFDGLGYTFNGYGEYNLFQIEDIELMVQVRIAPITINGTQSQGTVYKALSIKANNNTDHIQIELDFKNNLLITLNGEYIDIENESISLKGLHLIVSDGTKIELVYNFGINIEILVSPSRNALTLFSTISQIYMNRTVGLLGNFNADPSDDFILPNGTILNIDAKNDRDIFENYGQKWMIRENDSIFFYELGFGYDSHHDIDYVPKFIQDGLVFNNSDLEIVAKEKCGNNTDCLFDASITGDIEIAKLNLDSDVVAKSFEEVKIHRNNSNNLNSTREFYQITSTETESKAVISSNTKITENYQFINSESTYAYETKSIENSKNPKINQTIFQINTSSFHKALTSLSKVNEISDYIDNHKYSTIFSTKNYFTTNKDTSKNFKTDAIKISDSISPTLSNINQSIFKEKDNNEFGKGRAAMMGKIGSLINLSLFRYF